MSRYVKQINPKQNKSFKSKPVSEGGLGLSPRTDGGSIDSDIKKAKENKLAQYWYDKYENLVKEVSYERKIDRQNLSELDEKLDGVNQGLLSETASIAPLVLLMLFIGIYPNYIESFVPFRSFLQYNTILVAVADCFFLLFFVPVAELLTVRRFLARGRALSINMLCA